MGPVGDFLECYDVSFREGTHCKPPTSVFAAMNPLRCHTQLNDHVNTGGIQGPQRKIKKKKKTESKGSYITQTGYE